MKYEEYIFLIREELIIELGYEPKDYYLVGSFVYGKVNKSSDIDIIINEDHKVNRVIRSRIGVFDIKFNHFLGIFKINHSNFGNKFTFCLNLSYIDLRTGDLFPGNKGNENFYVSLKAPKSNNVRQKNNLPHLWGTNLINIKCQ